MDDPNPATTRYVNLTTYRRDGRSVTTPVAVVAWGERLYVGTWRDSGKCKRIRAKGRVRLVPCDARGRREFGRAYVGTAQVVRDAALRAAVQRRFIAKYGLPLHALAVAVYLLRRRHHQRVLLELDCRPCAPHAPAGVKGASPC